MKWFITTMAVFLLTLLYLACASGCKKKGRVREDEWRPPVLEGKCVVDRYFEGKAYDQWCNYNGYAWKCGPEDCVRTGDAKTERVAPEPGMGSGSGSGSGPHP